MPNRGDAGSRLRRHFRRYPVSDLAALKRVLETPSRTTVFRALSGLGYLTSCNHAGRYYTLEDVPRFDEDGLWVHEGALFSRHRTLRTTLVHLVDVAPAGRTHSELQSRLRLRVHDTLRSLTSAGEIGRLRIERVFLYVAIDPVTAEAQVLERRRLLATPGIAEPPGPALVIEVLVTIIHDVRARADPSVIAGQLAARGVRVTEAQVEHVLQEHGIEKKQWPDKGLKISQARADSHRGGYQHASPMA